MQWSENHRCYFFFFNPDQNRWYTRSWEIVTYHWGAINRLLSWYGWIDQAPGHTALILLTSTVNNFLCKCTTSHICEDYKACALCWYIYNTCSGPIFYLKVSHLLFSEWKYILSSRVIQKKPVTYIKSRPSLRVAYYKKQTMCQISRPRGFFAQGLYNKRVCSMLLKVWYTHHPCG